MSLNKISIYIERNIKIEYRKYTIYKATLYLKTILLKNVFLNWSVWTAGIAGDLFLKLYLVILVSGKLALRRWFGILKTFVQMQRKKVWLQIWANPTIFAVFKYKNVRYSTVFSAKIGLCLFSIYRIWIFMIRPQLNSIPHGINSSIGSSRRLTYLSTARVKYGPEQWALGLLKHMCT